MSSPIHHAKDLDAVLRYAPPWARDLGRPAPTRLSPPPAESPSLSPHRGDSPIFSGDRAVLEMQRRLALNPGDIPEPPPPFLDKNETVGRIALRFCGVLVIAATIAGVIVFVPVASLLGHNTVQSGVSATPISGTLGRQDRLATAPQSGLSDTKLGRGQKVLQEQGERALWIEPAGAIAAGPTISEQPSPTMAKVPPTSQPTAPGLITRRLDRDEVTSLIKRGEDFIASGDLVSARLVLRRAADSGDAHAALALAGTFDPNLLDKLGIQGLAADPAMARLWYERAEKFGSAEAPQRLQQLATP